MSVKTIDVGVAVGGAGVLAAVGVLAVRNLGLVGAVLLVALAWGLAAVLLLEMYRRLSDQTRRSTDLTNQSIRDAYRQLESLLSLVSLIRLQRPLPSMRGFAGSPDLLNYLLTEVLNNRPRLVVEASSGVSTLILAYALKMTGSGRVVSLEHELDYARRTQTLIESHGLEDVARVVHAPLRSVEVDSKAWQWYDLDAVPTDQPIDLLVIDGPPHSTQPRARFPAVPLLWERLQPGAKIVLDDGNRPDEKAAVEGWKAKYPDLDVTFFPFEKGLYVLQKP
jgi:predicted O-methyltransferase YrrM